jgi:Rrf2 family iron-sulfur cluster assembly transcriptional regulator
LFQPFLIWNKYSRFAVANFGGAEVRVSKAEEYGMRLIMSLADEGSQMTIHDLAERELIPEPTVAKVVGHLRRAGLVAAARGRNGGYTLARPASGISLASIVDAFGESFHDTSICNRMQTGGRSCGRSASCGLRPVWSSLAELIGDHLAGITIADVIDREPGRTTQSSSQRAHSHLQLRSLTLPDSEERKPSCQQQ